MCDKVGTITLYHIYLAIYIYMLMNSLLYFISGIGNEHWQGSLVVEEDLTLVT